MHKLSVIGHFGFGREGFDGQTIKTKIVAEELRKIFGTNEVSFHDTHGGFRFLFRMPCVILSMLTKSNHIIMLPAQKGVRIISPLLVILNIFFRRRLHYVVIGGWLPEMTASNKFLLFILKRFNGIYVETMSMCKKLTAQGLKNVRIMPNCKKLNIVKLADTPKYKNPPYRLCTFSRVIKEKGIEDAIEAIKICNKRIGATIYTLDIYGQIGKEQQKWFNSLIENQPEYIKYCGCIKYSDSVDVLKNYFALLFPTYYEGECFAGTIIDAFAAALPIIASDWHDNANIIENGKNGLIFPTHSICRLTELLIKIYDTPDIINKMKKECVTEAVKYQPENIIKTLVKYID